MSINQAAVLAKAAQSHSDRPAISLGTEVIWRYGELAARVAGLAGGLREKLGLNLGDRVVLAMKNVPAFYEALFAIWHAGLTAVPANAKLHGREFHYIVENSGARACLVTPDLEDTFATMKSEIPALEHVICSSDATYQDLVASPPMTLTEISPDDIAWLFYTSGTTGRPKGAMLSHRNLMAMVMNYFADVDNVGETDCMIHCAPLSHGSGLYGLPHFAKGANNIIPTSGGFDPAECFELISHWPNCSFFFAPTMITRLINAPGMRDADTSHLKTIIYGGAPMYVEDILKTMEVLGPKLTQIYGQGEAPMTITGLSKAAHAASDHPQFIARLGSAGSARTDLEVRVVDADDAPLPTGETGEIVCRGDVVMMGYYHNHEATAEALRGGWLHTGDVGSFDEFGILTLRDRAKDMIISGGSNIYPREVEEVLLKHAGVLECAVVGAPHADWGEEVIAFITRRPGSTVGEAELDQLCLDNIARFKRPKSYRFIADLPKNNYGKVVKTTLRAVLAAEKDATGEQVK